MPTVSESATIMADIEDVFALISRVEQFPRYARNLKTVQKIGRRTYRWVARIGGVTLTWDSIISEFRRPTQLSWRSIRGFENTGTYTLARIPGGTRVELLIDYRVTGALVGEGIARLLTPVHARRGKVDPDPRQRAARRRAAPDNGITGVAV